MKAARMGAIKLTKLTEQDDTEVYLRGDDSGP